MAEEWVRDYQLAKQKACERLGLDHRCTPLPANREIEVALATRLRLFRGAVVKGALHSARTKAVEIMRLFAPFQPRLVGALLRGNITHSTPIELHLFAESPDEVAQHIRHHHIPCRAFDRRVRFAGRRFVQVPGFRFDADDGTVELLTFSSKQLREAPICPVEGRPMRRASLRAVEQLLRPPETDSGVD